MKAFLRDKGALVAVPAIVLIAALFWLRTPSENKRAATSYAEMEGVLQAGPLPSEGKPDAQGNAAEGTDKGTAHAAEAPVSPLDKFPQWNLGGMQRGPAARGSRRGTGKDRSFRTGGHPVGGSAQADAGESVEGSARKGKARQGRKTSWQAKTSAAHLIVAVSTNAATGSSQESQASAPSSIPTRASTPEKPDADAVREVYEGDPSRYPLDAEASSGKITMRVLGVVRSRWGYILKLSVVNRGTEDFFIQGLRVRGGVDIADSTTYFRLFVEPGRTREGYVLFNAPSAGKPAYLALKEDRENGRALEAKVQYPF
ncbi:MAG: hypothetical protein WCU88_09855 [Elusimicrobiota bacterium]|jgi:hypothetical protein